MACFIKFKWFIQFKDLSYLNLFCFFLEKEAVRKLITSAIKGLEDSGRIEPTAYYDENVKGIQVNMDTFGSLMSNK